MIRRKKFKGIAGKAVIEGQDPKWEGGKRGKNEL